MGIRQLLYHHQHQTDYLETVSPNPVLGGGGEGGVRVRDVRRPVSPMNRLVQTKPAVLNIAEYQPPPVKKKLIRSLLLK